MGEQARRFGVWIGIRPIGGDPARQSAALSEAAPRGGVAGTVLRHREERKKSGIAWQFGDRPAQCLGVGDPFRREFPEQLGIIGEKLTERHVAFLLIVMLEDHQGPANTWDEHRKRRARFRRRMGMTDDGFEKWLKRNLTLTPGRVLRWNERRNLGRGPAQSQGPWWIAAKEVHIEPDRDAAEELIARQARDSAFRANNPAVLLQRAEAERTEDNWPEALHLAEEAARIYWTSDRPRDARLWFDILLAVGGIEMQMGRQGLGTALPVNIRRSLSNPRQRLTGIEAKVIYAESHHLAALVENQRGDRRGSDAAMRALGRGRQALEGLKAREAIRKLWQIQTYEELTRAKAFGEARSSKHASRMWKAIEVFRDFGEPARSEQERMRYGESLLWAGQPSSAIRHVETAIASNDLTTAARVIAERVRASALWASGKSQEAVLSYLELIELRARSLGFSHQVREIQAQKDLVRLGVRGVAVKRT